MKIIYRRAGVDKARVLSPSAKAPNFAGAVAVVPISGQVVLPPARKRRKKHRQRGPIIGRFVHILLSVGNSEEFIALSPHALKLFLDLLFQYNGKNNGDLCATWTLMRKRNWRSEATLNEAKKELIRSGLLQEMRKGRRPNLCSLYAFTWLALDYMPGKHDFGPNGFEPFELRRLTSLAKANRAT